MRSRGLILALLLASSVSLQAQYSFSDSLEIFYPQVLTKLRALGTEPANKVAFDFANSWTGSFTTQQQQQIHRIARLMDKKGYSFRPHFWYYFSYLAYADTQAKLSSAELSKVLDINEQVVKTMNMEQYHNFLLGMNTYMARRILSQTRNLLMTTDEGSYSFALLDEVVKEEPKEEPPVQDPVIEEAPPVEEEDPWQDDPWSNNDPWAQSDPWSAPKKYDDNWVEDKDTWGYDDAGSVYEGPAERNFVAAVAQDYIGGVKSRYLHPEIEGPVIDLQNNSLLIVTPYDSLQIRDTDGYFLLATRNFAGENAVVKWPGQFHRHAGAEVKLGKYLIRADRSDFWSPNATMSHPTLFDGNVEGVFEYNSVVRKPGAPGSYPRFTSFRSNVRLKLPNSKVSFTGGVQIRGNAVSGTSIDRVPGVLEILDGKGNKVLFRALKFDFRSDSTIVSADASITVIQGADSLYHPSVEMKYDAKTGRLTALKTAKSKTTPFTSSYFGVTIAAEVLKWNVGESSIELSLMNGKSMLPMVVESLDFFDRVRFEKLYSGMPFHPVVTSVFYARKFQTDQFSAGELANEYKVPLNQVQGAMRKLAEFGFATYNAETDVVTLTDKAYFYYDAVAKQRDFDNIMLPSIEPSRPNSIWNLDSGYLELSGVERFFFTTDYKVYAEPDSNKVRLGKNRAVVFDGAVEAGEFRYLGKSFQMDYDGFFVEMPQIDSIAIQITVPDSLRKKGDPRKKPLANHLTETAGTLYLDDPQNKSGNVRNSNYPDFFSSKDAVVYFDRPEVLGGAYDRSVKFLIPPFETDSLSGTGDMRFIGRFNSGGIFPTFDDTLHIMPDQSLGFVHNIPAEGYSLYGTPARTYEKITLSNMGLRGGGKIDFITSTIYSRDFVYYPDSVAAVGTGGVIRPGEVNGASYPEAVLGPYRMHWEPRIDSMYLRNLRQPFKFYNATAQLDGAIDITSKGVYGTGTMLTRGSKAVSPEFSFRQHEYSARNAQFEVLTENPAKPAMRGDDVSLDFDLIENEAEIHPEREGVASLSFPYAQMKTSITTAIWDLEDSVVTMTKPASVPLENSYFYSTRKELDSLAFMAEEAVYDFNTRELNVKGIPYIIVADARIIPANGETTILENSELQPFHDAQLIIDTLNGYHYLHSGEIKILSRNSFIGSALYQVVNQSDTFDIKFDSFVLEDVYTSPGKKQRMTVSGGEVIGKQNLIISPGFYYKGGVRMFAYKKALELSGFVKLMRPIKPYDYWVHFERKDENPEVLLDFNNATFEDETPAIAGLQYDMRGSVYPTFVEKRRSETDQDLFFPKGLLSYDTTSGSYKIEHPQKGTGESYFGHTMIFNDSSKNIVFEGPVTFFGPYTQGISVKASILGAGNFETELYSGDAMLMIDMPMTETFMQSMADDLLELIERLGPALANEMSIALMYKLANVTSDAIAKGYESSNSRNYQPLHSASEQMLKSLVISGTRLNWSKDHKAWYNTTKLAVSNIYKNDINAKLDGFLEIKKDASNNDVLNLFIQAAPGTWYFISYQGNTLMMYSSNQAFNDGVNLKSNYGKAKAGEMVLVGGDENETLSFVNEFRRKYFGITEPFSLSNPDEVLDEDTFETIEQVDDDSGFGF